MAKNQGKVGEAASPIVKALPIACSDEAAAVEFLEQMRWGDAPRCPHCGGAAVYRMTAMNGARNARYLWRCHGCDSQYTVRIGTVLEDSRIPATAWCYAFWACCASKKGVSALQISRQTGLSYKSALFLMHRVRFAMAPASGPTAPPLGGPGKDVEADETYVGGKPRNRGMKYGNKRGRGTKKTPVFALVERGGGVRFRVLDRVSAETIGPAIRENADFRSRLLSDESQVYTAPGAEFVGGHETTNHGSREYARPGGIHSNTAESVFALVKRGMMGIFHSVSKKHLHRYLDEFAFRWNHRFVDDGARTAAAIKAADGKRLLYRQPA